MKRKKETIAEQPPAIAHEAEDRHQRIAKAAYLRAAERGFSAGDPLLDWLEAEKEIDRIDHPESAQER